MKRILNAIPIVVGLAALYFGITQRSFWPIFLTSILLVSLTIISIRLIYLRGFFRPSWKTKRIKRVDEVKSRLNFYNQDTIKLIAATAPHHRMRNAAIGLLNDTETLQTIAKNDSEKWNRYLAAKKAIGLLDDTETLLNIVKNDSDVDIRYLAAKKVPDTQEAQTVFQKICSPNPKEKYLTEYSSYYDKLLEAAQLLHNTVLAQITYATIIESEKADEACKKAAVSLLTDQRQILDSIASENIDNEMLVSLIEKIQDESVLSKIAIGDICVPMIKDKAELVRKAAVERLTDQATLDFVVKNEEADSVRQIAVKLLTDQASLAYVAKNDENPKVRSIAVGRLTDQATLAYVAKNDADPGVRVNAVVGTDQATLAYVAENDNSPGVCSVAIGKLTDQAALMHVAKNNEYWDLRLKAADKLSDSKNIEQVYSDVIEDILNEKGQSHNTGKSKIILDVFSKYPQAVLTRWKRIESIAGTFHDDHYSSGDCDHSDYGMKRDKFLSNFPPNLQKGD